MIYVFDTSSFSELKHFYRGVFKSIWEGLDELIQKNRLISTREVWNELQRGTPDRHPYPWLKERKHIFTTPNNNELSFVTEILSHKHFQALIGKQAQLKGTPVADPFVIACAKIQTGTVVTQEGWDYSGKNPLLKPNAPKIPQVCQHYSIPCLNLELFMNEQGWHF